MDRTTSNRLADEAAAVLGSQQLRERHFDCYLASWPASWSGGQDVQPQPTLKRLTPRPRVVPKDTLAISENEGGGHEQAILQRFELEGISRHYSALDLRCDFWLIVEPGTEVNPANAGNIRPRYRPLSTPNAMQNSWSVTLVEER